MHSDWKAYNRVASKVEMRPYVKGEDMTGISVSETDKPEDDMGMIARRSDDHNDKWYVARQWFADNYEQDGEEI